MELIYQSVFKSWKTTLTAIIGAVAWVLAQNGYIISPEQKDAVLMTALLVIGFFSKDATISHTQE